MNRDFPEDDPESFDQSVLTPFIRRRIALPIMIFAVSWFIYLFCATGAVVATSLAAKIILGVIAGVFIANLAIIGHDAIHRSFTSSRLLNRAIGTLAFLPALHPYGRWEHHHNRVHHRYTAQIGVDNAFPPLTLEQYRVASPAHRLYYRFMRSLAGQPLYYMIDIWLPKIFLPSEARSFKPADWIDFAVVYGWITGFIAGLAWLALPQSGGRILPALWHGTLFGFLIPFLVWNLFISFVTIVQHTGPRAHWVMPTGRPSTHEQKLRGTVHVRFPDPLDWFFHRVMQHIVHHVNPMVPLYRLKGAEHIVIAGDPKRVVAETWTPAYHWRLTRDCKLYDPVRDGWCRFDAAQTAEPAGTGLALQ
jgi:omega-6 fatty acid desaturase (delta-12 desaturase)